MRFVDIIMIPLCSTFQRKNPTIACIIGRSDQTVIKDRHGFLAMPDALAFGFIRQVKGCLCGESERISAEIVTEMNELFKAALTLYR